MKLFKLAGDGELNWKCVIVKFRKKIWKEESSYVKVVQRRVRKDVLRHMWNCFTLYEYNSSKNKKKEYISVAWLGQRPNLKNNPKI